jgi:lysophospholipase L1-like esterase
VGRIMRTRMTLILPVLALLIGELCLRHYHQRTARRALPMELRAETRVLSWDHIKDKRRIVCLGDSITYGEDLSAQQAFPAVLATLLSSSQDGSPVVVINAGIRGNTAVQGLDRVGRDVLWYQPDAVIIAFGWNDGRLGFWPLDPMRERQMLGERTAMERLDALLRHSHLWPTLRARGRRLLRRLGWTAGTTVFETEGDARPRVSHRGFEFALTGLIEAVRKGGCSAILLLTTTPVSQGFVEQLEPEWRARQLGVYAEYNQLARAAAIRYGVPLVDLYADFESADLPLLLAPDGIHLTAEGERRVAMRVQEAIVQNGLLDQRR